MAKFVLILTLIVTFGCAQTARKPAATLESSEEVPMKSPFWPYHLEGCLNTKDLYLASSSRQPVKYSKRNGKNCHVIGGLWFDYFTMEPMNDPEKVQVTTVVPLKHAQQGKRWSLRKIIEFVHDTDQLLAITKGGVGESLYLKNSEGLRVVPANDKYHACQIGNVWMDTKEKWSIPFEGDDQELLGKLITQCSDPDFYNRSTFPHWSTQPASKCDTRYEVMKRDANPKVALKTKRDNPTCKTNSQKGCNPCVITEGEWFDVYGKGKIKVGGEIDVDHFVPLGNAFISGAWRWPIQKRERYANFMADPNHLISVSARENRAKGARHPGNYMPPNKAYQCEYLENWIGVKLRWGLELSANESEAIKKNIVENCPHMGEEYLSTLDILVNPLLSEIGSVGE